MSKSTVPSVKTVEKQTPKEKILQRPRADLSYKMTQALNLAALIHSLAYDLYDHLCGHSKYDDKALQLNFVAEVLRDLLSENETDILKAVEAYEQGRKGGHQ